MLDFDIILGTNWLHAYHGSIDCRTQKVKFQFPNKPILVWVNHDLVVKGTSISCLKAREFISKGCIYNLVRV